MYQRRDFPAFDFGKIYAKEKENNQIHFRSWGRDVWSRQGNYHIVNRSDLAGA